MTNSGRFSSTFQQSSGSTLWTIWGESSVCISNILSATRTAFGSRHTYQRICFSLSLSICQSSWNARNMHWAWRKYHHMHAQGLFVLFTRATVMIQAGKYSIYVAGSVTYSQQIVHKEVFLVSWGMQVLCVNPAFDFVDVTPLSQFSTINSSPLYPAALSL